MDGIYNLLKSTLDSIQEAPILLTPQNLIRLLNESGKIGEPLLLQSHKNKTEEQNIILQNIITLGQIRECGFLLI